MQKGLARIGLGDKPARGDVRISVCGAQFSLTHHWANECMGRVIVTASPTAVRGCSLVRLKRLFLRPDLALSGRGAQAVSNPPLAAGPEPRAAAAWRRAW